MRPPAPEATREDARVCDHAGCRAPAITPAPRRPRAVDQPAADPYWFCQAHAAEYNRAWNVFEGLSEAQIRARIEAELTTGGRPTWSLHSGGRNREAAWRRGPFKDAFGLFGAGRPPAGPVSADPRLGKLERAALDDLGLDAGAAGAAIRARYIELVKRCHPDANGGDRSAEHKLQRVLRAYQTLRKAKLA